MEWLTAPTSLEGCGSTSQAIATSAPVPRCRRATALSPSLCCGAAGSRDVPCEQPVVQRAFERASPLVDRPEHLIAQHLAANPKSQNAFVIHNHQTPETTTIFCVSFQYLRYLESGCLSIFR